MAIDKVLNLSSTQKKVTKSPFPTKTPAKKQLLGGGNKNREKVRNTSMKTLVFEDRPEPNRKFGWRDMEAPTSTTTFNSFKPLVSTQNKSSNMPEGNYSKVAKNIEKREEDPNSEATSSGTPMVKWSNFASPSSTKL